MNNYKVPAPSVKAKMILKLLSVSVFCFCTKVIYADQDESISSTAKNGFSASLALLSQYVDRGLTETDHGVAVLSQINYQFKDKFHFSVNAKNTSVLRDAETPAYIRGGVIEFEPNVGYLLFKSDDFYDDVGFNGFYSPGVPNPISGTIPTPPITPPSDNGWEFYNGIGWKWLSLYIHVTPFTNYFGVTDAQGSWYLDASLNIPMESLIHTLKGLTFNAHWGWQQFNGTDPRNIALNANFFPGAPYNTTPNNSQLNTYQDLLVGASYLWAKPNLLLGASYTRTYNANVLTYGSTSQCLSPGFCGPYPSNIAAATVTAFIQKNF